MHGKFFLKGIVWAVLALGTLPAQEGLGTWLELLRESDEVVADEVTNRTSEARAVLEELVRKFDSSIHSRRSQPEQRRVRYSQEYLEAGLRLSRIFGQVTGESKWDQRFRSREARIQATVALNDKEFEKALELIDQARTLARATGDRAFLYSTYLTTAYAHLEQGQPEEALADCRTALDLARELEDHVKLALAYYNLGAAQLHLGNPRDALEPSRMAVSASRKIGFRLWEANARLNLGSAELMSGRFEPAEAEFRHALQLARQVGDALAEGRAFFNLGVLYVALQDWQRARRNLELSLEFITKVDIRHSHEIEEYNPVEKSALENLLLSYEHLGLQDSSLIDPIRERLAVLAKLREKSGHHHEH